jgi:hypothetical protein
MRAGPPASSTRSAVLHFLPYALTGALVTLVLTWDFLVSQTGAQGALAVLWDAFTTRVDKTTYGVIRSSMLLIMLIFTWLVGCLIALGEAFLESQAQPTTPSTTGSGVRSEIGNVKFRWGLNAGVYLGATVGTFLVYGLIQAGRTSLDGLSGMDALRQVANHVVIFDLALFLLGLGLAAAIWWSDRRPHPERFFGRSFALSVTAGAVRL